MGAAGCICHLQHCPCHRPHQPVPFWGSASRSGFSQPMPPTHAISSESTASPAQDLTRSQGGGPGRAPARALLSPSPPPSGNGSPGLLLCPMCAPAGCHAEAKPSLSPLPISSTTSPIFSPRPGRGCIPRGAAHLGNGASSQVGSRLQQQLPAGHIPPCSEAVHPHLGRHCQHGCGATARGWMHTSTFHWAHECGGTDAAPGAATGLSPPQGSSAWGVCVCVPQANMLLAVTITSL